MNYLRRTWASVVAGRVAPNGELNVIGSLADRTAIFGNIGADDFYEWEGRLESIYGSGRRVADRSAQALTERVLGDYGIDPATVDVKVGVGETYTEFQFSTQTAKVRLSTYRSTTWSLLHELAHVILFHRHGKEHEYDHHGVDLQVQLTELLDRYTGIRLKDIHRVPYPEQIARWRFKQGSRTTAAPRRTDQHSILNLDPERYKYVMFVDLVAAEQSEQAQRILEMPYGGGNMANIDWAYSVYSEADMLNARKLYERLPRNGFQGNFANRGGCDHCGAPGLRYVNVYAHDSGDWIVVGSTCAERVGLDNRNAYEMDRAKRAQEARKKAEELRRKKEAWLASADPEVVVALTGLLTLHHDTGTTGNFFLNDMVRAFKNYGNLSERQAAAMLKTLADLESRKQREEAERVSPKPKMPVPTGVVDIVGTVMSVKEQHSQWGTTWKCLVVDDRGFKVWGTIPSSAAWDKGDRVAFTANVEPSNDDESFGFYSRPRKVKAAPPG